MCTPGYLQLEYGGTSCTACPSDYANLPGELPAEPVVTNVCGSLAHGVVLNWGPVETPTLLASNVTVGIDSTTTTTMMPTGLGGAMTALHPWLTARVTAGKIVMLTSDLVPAAANGALSVTLAVMHTCRSTPWIGTVTFDFLRTDPVLVSVTAAKTGSGTVEACPDFAAQYSGLLGTCSAQTTVVAALANGSSLPSFVSYAYGDGVLQIVGSVPAGTEAFDVVGVAQLGSEAFVSSPTTVKLAPVNALQVASPPSASSGPIQACPYVSVTFTVTRASSCGQLRAWALLANGSALPSFLSSALSTGEGSSATSLTVFGTAPEHNADFSIVASATTGGMVYNSTPVTITRPQLTSNANMSATVLGNATFISSSKSSPLEAEALYGVPLHIAASIVADAKRLCSSLSLAVSTNAPGSSDGLALQLPVWVTVTSTSGMSILISATATSDVAPGTATVVYVWANDGLRNPGFNVTIVTKMSLRINTTSASLSSGSPSAREIFPTVVTPASLLQMQLDVVGIAAGSPSPVLICPTTATAAFCSVSGDGTSVGAFGTPAGVNAVMQAVSMSMAGMNANSSYLLGPNASLLLTFKESINPNALTVMVPVSALKVYSGMTQIKPLVLVGKVGKQILEPVADYFHSDGDAASATYELSSNVSWLAIQVASSLGLLRDHRARARSASLGPIGTRTRRRTAL